jgi:hypothetical protein
MSNTSISSVWVRAVGDSHGKYDKYCKLACKAPYSLQVGDMGFDYSYIERCLDSSKHKIISGNHDNYSRQPCEDISKECLLCKGKGFTYFKQTKHFLGDYGVHQIPNFPPIFFVRGAWSIDKDWRRPGIDWWENEELTYAECEEALQLYEQIKPDFMVTHTAPDNIVPMIPFERIFGDTLHHPRTEQLLMAMWEIHQPKIWIFGHFHIDWTSKIPHPKTGKETLFICLDELSYMDFPENFTIDSFEPSICRILYGLEKFR